MSFNSRYSAAGVNLGGTWSPAVRVLILANIGIWILQIIAERMHHPLEALFGLIPYEVNHGQIWRLVTYMFLHGSIERGGIFHLVFNMLMLWMFGSALEYTWGTRPFLRYYFTCGIGAGIIHWLLSLGEPSSILVGASGAIFGLLLAYGMLFPDTIIYLYFFFPVKAKYLVMILGGIEFVSSLAVTPDGIGHFAHLGGILVGFIYLRGGDRIAWWLRGLTGRFHRRQRARVIDIRQKRKARTFDEIDAILDKISAEGYESLTQGEKRRLREAGSDRERH